MSTASPAPQQLDFDQLAAAPASTSTSASSTKTSSSSVAATATASANNFYLKDANNKFLGCSAGNDGIASYVSSQAAATQFYIDSKTGYLYQAGAAYAANRGTSSIPEITYFSTIGQSYSYITCTQNTVSAWLECKANNVTPDTADAFLAYAPFHSMASAAPTVVPSNNVAGNAYQQTFRDLNGSSSANSYLGLYTLTSYSPADCAAHCDTTTLCTAFNIYIERDPSQNPSKNDSTDPTVWGYWCPTPSSITNFKCTLWGSNLESATATNQGGWRKDFQVVITGSNGYDATNVTFPPTVVDTVDNSTSTATSAVSSVLSTATAVLPSSSAVSSSVSSSVLKASSTSTSASASATATTSPSGPTWTSPKTCGGKAINAPNYWMGSKFFPGPFNPQVCADYASYQHVVNKKTAIAAGKSYFTPCNSFNAYYLHKNGIPHGTYCALYDASISTSYATYTGGYSGSNKYDCRQSYQYTRQTLDQGRC
ncbi:hypothetical protein D6D05_02465 [Aureobasidium pullulans]|nr:hypothetical protein D6D05_02465 [Aureobasidium pullulans]